MRTPIGTRVAWRIYNSTFYGRVVDYFNSRCVVVEDGTIVSTLGRRKRTRIIVSERRLSVAPDKTCPG